MNGKYTVYCVWIIQVPAIIIRRIMKKLVTHKKLQHYKKHYGTTCITGLFGCRWQRYQQSTKDTGKVDLAWYMWLLVCAVFVTFVLYYWILCGNDYDDFNWYLYDNTGNLWPLYTIVLSLTCILFVYVALLFLLSLVHVCMGHEVHMHWVHRSVLILCIACAVVILVLMTELYSHGWTLQRISLMITGPWLHLCAVVIMTFMAWFIAGYFYTLHNRYIKAAFLTTFAVTMICIYISPVFIDSPCICENNDLPHRPHIFTHRGASALVPENTVEAFKEAATYSHVMAFESDVTVSYDGVPFLMHDRTLIRTTDVESKFSGREDDCACSFNISEIKQLNAGRWFFDTDPHGTVSQTSEEKKDKYKRLKVPTLSEFLEVMKQHKKKFLFDIQTYEYGIPDDHPYVDDIGDIIIKTIQDSGVIQKDVLWLYEDVLNTTIPHQFTIIEGKNKGVDSLLQLTDSNFNVPYYRATYNNVQSYLRHNVSVNVWVVNSEWLYSLYWCMGVQSVTTNYVHTFSKMSSPVWHLTPRQFEAMWVVVDFVSAVSILIIFIAQRIRNGGPTKFHQEISIQNARQHITQKNQQRKYMREKLIRSADNTEATANELENAALEGADSQSIDSSISVDVANIGEQMVKLDNLARSRNKEDTNHNNGLVGQSSKTQAETSLEDITVHVEPSDVTVHVLPSDVIVHQVPKTNNQNGTRGGTDNTQTLDNFEHEYPIEHVSHEVGNNTNVASSSAESQNQNIANGCVTYDSSSDATGKVVT